MRYSIFSVNDHHPRLERTVPELYRQVMRQCELAEVLGYDTFFCAEHHFHEYGVVPNPAVMLSALASLQLGDEPAGLPVAAEGLRLDPYHPGLLLLHARLADAEDFTLPADYLELVPASVPERTALSALTALLSPDFVSIDHSPRTRAARALTR